MIERWPGYEEQSWSERFARLDQLYNTALDRMAKMMEVGIQREALLASAINPVRVREEGYQQGIEAAAKVADENRTDDDSMWDRAASTIATAIRNLGGSLGDHHKTNP